MKRRDWIGSSLAAAVAASSQAATHETALPSAVEGVTPGREHKVATEVRARDGTRLVVRDVGHGPALLLLAGWGLPSDMWSHVSVALAQQGHRCVSYDRRGHGRSDHPGSGYDFDTLAADLACVVEALDLRACTLVGFSMGAGEAIRYLTQYGHARVQRLVLVAPVTPCLARKDDYPQGLDEALFERSRLTMTEDFPKWLDDNEGPFFVDSTSSGMRRWVKALMLQSSLHALIECQRSFTSADFRRELRSLKIPTLVIQGDRDASLPLPLTGVPTARTVEGARLEIYKGAPHGLFVTHATRLARDLAAFASG